MPRVHRDTDARNCDGTTKVQSENTSVYVNDLLWAVRGTEETPAAHGGGPLINTHGDTVFVEGKPVIVKGDLADTDHAGHTANQDAAKGASPNVYAYGS